MMKKVALAGIAAAALLSVPALAIQQERIPGREMARASVEAMVQTQFSKVDANGDGFVTRDEGKASRDARKAERQAHRAERRAERFARLDANGDGSITRAEFDAPRADRGDRAERRADRRERRAERRERRMERRAHRGMRFGAKRFERMDANQDGRVSLAEATALRLQRFDRIDANKDGTITREERRAARQAGRG
jgi:Ca2+-binding EF-hand superfamily protein